MNPRTAFFDQIADRWDGWENLDTLAARLSAGLSHFGVGPDESVVDVGCGTGNLAGALLARLSPRGKIAAVDVSPRMIDAARRKIADSRVAWYVADAQALPLPDRAFDRAICFSVWPHFDAPETVARELHRILVPGGFVHVWHLMSRHRINEIHSQAGEAVRRDLLVPADEIAALLRREGFSVQEAEESDSDYRVTARKVAE